MAIAARFPLGDRAPARRAASAISVARTTPMPRRVTLRPGAIGPPSRREAGSWLQWRSARAREPMRGGVGNVLPTVEGLQAGDASRCACLAAAFPAVALNDLPVAVSLARCLLRLA